MNRFDGAVCLVTGGSSGIGRAVAEGFAREGAAAVVVAGRRTELGEVVAEELRRGGIEALFLRTDVAEAQQVDDLIASAVERYGRIDCAVNNAAVEGPGLLTAEVDEPTFDRVVATNLKGVWLCLRAELIQMVRQGSGAIVNMSSINALMAAPGASVYSATKQGVLGLTRTSAVEYAAHGIRVNAVCAGPCRTPMLERVARRESGGDTARVLEESAEVIPLGRLAEPPEIAEAALWLCSPAASFVTGHAIVADGGLSAR